MEFDALVSLIGLVSIWISVCLCVILVVGR